jgi:hypothetical protein
MLINISEFLLHIWVKKIQDPTFPMRYQSSALGFRCQISNLYNYNHSGMFFINTDVTFPLLQRILSNRSWDITVFITLYTILKSPELNSSLRTSEPHDYKSFYIWMVHHLMSYWRLLPLHKQSLSVSVHPLHKAIWPLEMLLKTWNS